MLVYFILINSLTFDNLCLIHYNNIIQLIVGNMTRKELIAICFTKESETYKKLMNLVKPKFDKIKQFMFYLEIKALYRYDWQFVKKIQPYKAFLKRFNELVIYERKPYL
jgi:hypothetical protein